MKEVKYYVCEICGRKYEDENIAMRCEQFHIEPQKILSAVYKGKYNFPTKYPTSVLIEMEDGDAKWFYTDDN